MNCHKSVIAMTYLVVSLGILDFYRRAMKTFFRPQTLLFENNRFEAVSYNARLIQNKCEGDVANAVIVFSHHRDVRVALDDFRNAGLISDRLILMARNAGRYSWHRELTAYNYFDVEEFDCIQADKDFFWQLFQKGKYLLLISGTRYDVDSATRIVARRRGHAEVWHFEELLAN